MRGNLLRNAIRVGGAAATAKMVMEPYKNRDGNNKVADPSLQNFGDINIAKAAEFLKSRNPVTNVAFNDENTTEGRDDKQIDKINPPKIRGSIFSSLQQEELFTKYHNIFASYVLDLGYFTSLANGGIRLMPEITPEMQKYADKFQSMARFSYNASSTSTSYGRAVLTHPEARDSEMAREYAEWSRAASWVSVAHGLAVISSYFLKESALQEYLKKPGFNGTAFIAALAAYWNNVGYSIESDLVLTNIMTALEAQNPELFNSEEAKKFCRENVLKHSPHIPPEEVHAKSLSYAAGGIAALGGLAGILDILKKYYPDNYKNLESLLKPGALAKMVTYGGMINGVFYMLAPYIYAAFVGADDDSPERRFAEKEREEHAKIHEEAKSQFIIAIATLAMVLVARRVDPAIQGKIAKYCLEQIKKISDIGLGKADCAAGAISLLLYANTGREITSEPFHMRRHPDGNRLKWLQLEFDYIRMTDSGLSITTRTENLRALMNTASVSRGDKPILFDKPIDKMTENEMRDYLENGKCVEENGRITVKLTYDNTGDPLWQAAYYVKCIRADNAKGFPGNGVNEEHKPRFGPFVGINSTQLQENTNYKYRQKFNNVGISDVAIETIKNSMKHQEFKGYVLDEPKREKSFLERNQVRIAR